MEPNTRQSMLQVAYFILYKEKLSELQRNQIFNQGSFLGGREVGSKRFGEWCAPLKKSWLPH